MGIGLVQEGDLKAGVGGNRIGARGSKGRGKWALDWYKKGI